MSENFGGIFDISYPTCTFFLLFFFLKWRLAHAHLFHSYARISSQWLSKLRRLWLNVPWWVACQLVSWSVPTLCLDSSLVSPLQFHWVKGVCMFRCNLPPALLAEWPGSFTSYCSNTGEEQTQNKSQHTKLTLEKKNLLPLLPGFELAIFRSRVRHSNQQAIPAIWSYAVQV